MTVTELPNGRIIERRQPEELRYIFFGGVVKKAYTYYLYFDGKGGEAKLTPSEYKELQRRSADVPVRITECRFVYRDRFFKTSFDTTDSDLVLGAIVEKDRRKIRREAKLRDIGRTSRKEDSLALRAEGPRSKRKKATD